MSGFFFDDLEVGQTIPHALTRTVTESDNVQFCTMTHNPQPLHLDAEYAAKSEFGQRLVNSMFTASLAVGVSVQDTTLGTLLANLGYGEMTFPKPVFIGDTLMTETVVISKRASKSRPNAGIVTFEHRTHNQRNQLVCTVNRTALLYRRDPEA